MESNISINLLFKIIMWSFNIKILFYFGPNIIFLKFPYYLQFGPFISFHKIQLQPPFQKLSFSTNSKTISFHKTTSKYLNLILLSPFHSIITYQFYPYTILKNSYNYFYQAPIITYPFT